LGVSSISNINDVETPKLGVSSISNINDVETPKLGVSSISNINDVETPNLGVSVANINDVETPNLGVSVAYQPVDGWGVGSSAAFTTCLISAYTMAQGIQLNPAQIFDLARRAHRLAQGGEGSGVDIAASCFGGLIALQHANREHPPLPQTLTWPEDIGILLIRSPHKADTREMIRHYRQTSSTQATAERQALLRSVEEVLQSAKHGTDLLAALAENSRREISWSRALQLNFVTQLQLEIEQALCAYKHQLVIKALGAGGGDSIGCFYSRTQCQIADIIACIKPFALQTRSVQIDTQGVTTNAM
jgi:mevalonate kinase